MRGCRALEGASTGFDDPNQDNLRGLGSLLNLRIMSNVNASIAGYVCRVRSHHLTWLRGRIPGTNWRIKKSEMASMTSRDMRTCVLRQQ